MSSEHDEVKLPSAAEELLSDLPIPGAEPDWDALARRTLDAAMAAEADPPDAALLEAPLPPVEGEPGGAPDAAAAETDESPETTTPDTEATPDAEGPAPNLAAIAREAMAAQAAEERELAKASMSAAARARRAPSLKPGDEAPAMTYRSGELPAVEALDEPDARPKVVELPSRRPPSGPSRTAMIAVVGGLAAAAALVLFLRERQDETVAMSSEQERGSAPPELAPPPTPAPAEPEESGGSEEEASGTAEPEVLALDELPADEDSVGGDKAEPSPARKARAKGAAPRAAKKSAARPSRAPVQELALQEPEPSAPKKNAAPGTGVGAGMRPAAQPTDVPQRPSVGAVQAAVASVMSNAQMCLAGQDASAKATITFQADGHVKSVTVSGPAAGTPAEPCIKAGLAKARVSPFAEPTFSARVTVRAP